MSNELLHKKYEVMSAHKSWLPVVSNRYQLVKQVAELYHNGALIEISSNSNVRITDQRDGRDVYTTYDRCTYVELGTRDRLKVQVFNGDMMDGHPTDLRYQWTFQGKAWDQLPSLVQMVETAWQAHLRVMLSERQEQKQKRRMLALEEILLKGI